MNLDLEGVLLLITRGWSFGRITNKQGHSLSKQADVGKQ